MAQVTSAVDICNLALGHLKVEPVTNITTGESTEEKLCAKYYDITRQSVLESYNWAFATKRVSLSQDSDSPAFGFSYQSSSMPSDFLKLVGVYDSSGQLYINTNNQYYEFEGNKILSDITAPYYIKYIADITNVASFDRLFVMNLSYALAVTMSEAFKVSSTLLQVLTSKWQDIWEKNATTINGNHAGVIRVSKSKYINSRKV